MKQAIWQHGAGEPLGWGKHYCEKLTGSKNIRRGRVLWECREQEDTCTFLERIWINCRSRDKNLLAPVEIATNQNAIFLSYAPILLFYPLSNGKEGKVTHRPRFQRKANRQRVEQGSPQGQGMWVRMEGMCQVRTKGRFVLVWEECWRTYCT